MFWWQIESRWGMVKGLEEVGDRFFFQVVEPLIRKTEVIEVIGVLE
jgi:hypothetical protein